MSNAGLEDSGLGTWDSGLGARDLGLGTWGWHPMHYFLLDILTLRKMVHRVSRISLVMFANLSLAMTSQKR